jgi:hypothetical protein
VHSIIISFDQDVSAGCSLELGAILSISAAGAFYVASVVWCCMPRPHPMCKRLKEVERYDEPKSRDLAKEVPPAELEPDEMPAATVANSWQDVENRKPSFNQQQSLPDDQQPTAQVSWQADQIPAESSWQADQSPAESSWQAGQAPEPSSFQDHTANWEQDNHHAPTQQQQRGNEPFENPF